MDSDLSETTETVFNILYSNYEEMLKLQRNFPTLVDQQACDRVYNVLARFVRERPEFKDRLCQFEKMTADIDKFCE